MKNGINIIFRTLINNVFNQMIHTIEVKFVNRLDF